ncbi:hypothetical protein GWI33_021528 [Rhynchophorus ferrugineus]|uniref:Uncharacterized protein n=1 Tax=Rhynchophorus ferrugineus TaxID=354439 RepID=A0A834HNL0_RHYFE|nr:hypothetical protein GWI33_021528 [Rhynchophorus ferrugineus]
MLRSNLFFYKNDLVGDIKDTSALHPHHASNYRTWPVSWVRISQIRISRNGKIELRDRHLVRTVTAPRSPNDKLIGRYHEDAGRDIRQGFGQILPSIWWSKKRMSGLKFAANVMTLNRYTGNSIKIDSHYISLVNIIK